MAQKGNRPAKATRSSNLERSCRTELTKTDGISKSYIGCDMYAEVYNEIQVQKLLGSYILKMSNNDIKTMEQKKKIISALSFSRAVVVNSHDLFVEVI